MSADTTVVIAGVFHPGNTHLSFTAAVVWAAEDLLGQGEISLEKAKAVFLEQPRVWFGGVGGLSRAKQFANLLAEDLRQNGVLDREDRPIIEICEAHRLAPARTRRLSWMGNCSPEYFRARVVAAPAPCPRPAK